MKIYALFLRSIASMVNLVSNLLTNYRGSIS